MYREEMIKRNCAVLSAGKQQNSLYEILRERAHDPALLFLPKMSFRYKGTMWIRELFALNDNETQSNKKSTKKLLE